MPAQVQPRESIARVAPATPSVCPVRSPQPTGIVVSLPKGILVQTLCTSPIHFSGSATQSDFPSGRSAPITRVWSRSVYQHWPAWAANGIGADKPSYRRLASNGALLRGPPVNSPSRLRARLRPNHRSIVESSDSSGKLFNELACPAFKQCRSGGSWPFRTSRVAPRMLLLNGRVFRTAGTAHLSAVPPSAVAAPAPMAGVTRTSEL